MTDIRPVSLKSALPGPDSLLDSDSLSDSLMSRPKRITDGDGRLTEAFRNERLEHLRKQIADGTYHVSSRSVAAAMLVRHGLNVTGRARRQG